MYKNRYSKRIEFRRRFYMMYVFLGVLCFIKGLTALYLTTFIHELGHACMVLLNKGTIAEFEMGSGKNIFRIKKFTLSWGFKGRCRYDVPKNTHPLKQIIISLGGVIFTLLTAIVLIAYTEVNIFENLLQFKLSFTEWMLITCLTDITNLRPHKFIRRGKESKTDGLQVVEYFSLLMKK
ncbi:peptidase M50 [Bacillus cereus]|uniref:Peptidase M50 n=2 Tax=Bacillaceae TaxID=186817 RepID=A0A9X6VW79_BACCE|nr:peptidase M50 [Bacillus cereus]PFQ36573.1 peptidase M50 [Bacillus cereus]PGB17981.1 peptidase M50 [Bacillus toyonensis]